MASAIWERDGSGFAGRVGKACDRDAVSSHGLGLVEGAVGAMQNLVGRFARLGGCDSGAERHDPGGQVVRVRHGRALHVWSRSSRPTATSAATPASCWTSTSRSSGASHKDGPGIASTASAACSAARARTARAVGWEFVHVCVDDATRLAYAEVLADEKAITAVAFLRRAVAFYASYGITRSA